MVGAGLAVVERVSVVNTATPEIPINSAWVLQSFVSNVRYANCDEITMLRAVQPGLNRSEAVVAVLIPIKKMPSGGNWPRMSGVLFLKSNRIIPP